MASSIWMGEIGLEMEGLQRKMDLVRIYECRHVCEWIPVPRPYVFVDVPTDHFSFSRDIVSMDDQSHAVCKNCGFIIRSPLLSSTIDAYFYKHLTPDRLLSYFAPNLKTVHSAQFGGWGYGQLSMLSALAGLPSKITCSEFWHDIYNDIFGNDFPEIAINLIDEYLDVCIAQHHTILNCCQQQIVQPDKLGSSCTVVLTATQEDQF